MAHDAYSRRKPRSVNLASAMRAAAARPLPVTSPTTSATCDGPTGKASMKSPPTSMSQVADS